MKVANRSTGEEVVGEVRLYGLDAELYRKSEAKRDRDHETALGKWIEDVVGEKFSVPDDIIESLRSGIILCKLVNKIRPDSVKKINMKPIPLLEMENIGLYLKACWALGVPSAELFVTSDLYRRKDEPQVFVNIHSVARIAWRIPSFEGPKFGSTGQLSVKRETKWTGKLKEQKVLYVTDLEEAERRATEHQVEMERKSAIAKGRDEKEQVNQLLQKKLLEEQAKRRELEKELASLKPDDKLRLSFASPSSSDDRLQKEVESLRKALASEQRAKEEEISNWKKKLDREKEDFERQLKFVKEKDDKESAKKRLEKLQQKRRERDEKDKELEVKEEELRAILKKEFEKKEAVFNEIVAEMKKELEYERKLREEQTKYWKIRSGNLNEPLDKGLENLEKQLEDEKNEKAALQREARELKETIQEKEAETRRVERELARMKQEVQEATNTLRKQETIASKSKEGRSWEVDRLKRIVNEQERNLLEKEKHIRELKEKLHMEKGKDNEKDYGSGDFEEGTEEENLQSELANMKRSRRLTRLVTKKATHHAFLTAWDEDDKLGKEAVDGMTHTITRILYSSASVSREDVSPFLPIIQSDYGRRQLAFTLKTAIDKIPSVCLSADSFELMVELLSTTMKSIDSSKVKDFISTKVIMQAASRLCMKDNDGKTLLIQQRIKQFNAWKNIDYWEDIFWDTLVSQHKDTSAEDADVDSALVYGVLKTLAINMATWDVPLHAIRAFVTAMCDTNKLPIGIKNHLLDSLEAELQAPRGGSFIKMLSFKKRRPDNERERRELKKLFEETDSQKGSKKYIGSPGGRVRATILLPENMNQRPFCEFGETCKSTDPLHFLNHQHTTPVDQTSPVNPQEGTWRRSRSVTDFTPSTTDDSADAGPPRGTTIRRNRKPLPQFPGSNVASPAADEGESVPILSRSRSQYGINKEEKK